HLAELPRPAWRIRPRRLQPTVHGALAQGLLPGALVRSSGAAGGGARASSARWRRGAVLRDPSPAGREDRPSSLVDSLPGGRWRPAGLVRHLSAMTGSDPNRIGHQARCVLAGLVGLACAYTLHRAVVLRIEYYDGYDFLKNARALLHDPLAQYWLLRPPLVSLLQLPAVALGRASAPGAAVRLVAPHLTAALLAILTAGAVSWVLLRPVGPTLALLGTL